MNELNGKRLLVLGGSLWKEEIERIASIYGITVLATGNEQKAGIFEIADEKYSVDSTDIPAMKELIKRENVDGVYMGGSEPVIEAACQYLDDLGLPCYCKPEQWHVLQNKSLFKKECIKNDLPVVPQICFEDAVEMSADQYPLITKPEDGSGSNGFSICHSVEDLRIGYERAKQDSPSQHAIIEKFVNNQGHVVFYTVSDGVIYFSGLSDKYPVKYSKQESYVGGLFIYQSVFSHEFRKLFEKKIQKMISGLGIREGSFWIEVFHNEDNYYFNEAGFRYGGSVSVYPVNYYFGINQVATDIYFALTGTSRIVESISMIPTDMPRKKYYASYPVHIYPGKIDAIEGIKELEGQNNVLKILSAKSVGDVIADSGSFGQAFGIVHFVFDDFEELKETIERIHKTLIVNDTNGKSMIHRMLDTNSIAI